VNALPEDFRIVLVQSALAWEDPAANRLHFADVLGNFASGQFDLIVLPEMFTTGFSMEPSQVAEAFHPRMDTLQWMRHWAGELDAVITGSIAVSENGHYFNRLLWVRPDGTYSQYDKRHLFRMAGEHERYTPGDLLLIETWRGWRVCPLICYDLRFPVWSRNKLVADVPLYDVLLYVANWPAPRRDPWIKLLPARAIENQCYAVAVNRIGADGNNQEYAGDSAVVDPRGAYLIPPMEGVDVRTAVLSASDLADFRKKFPVLRDADEFEI